MNEYAIGQEVALAMTALDASNTPRDPSAATLEILLPDKTTVTKTLADFTRISQGVYEYYFVVTQIGRHRCHATATGGLSVGDVDDFLGIASG